MIVHESSYRIWLEVRGVGAGDRVASSPASYVSYLRVVSELLGEDLSPDNLADDADVLRILAQIRKLRSTKTIRNYGSSLRQYVAMVQAGAHP